MTQWILDSATDVGGEGHIRKYCNTNVYCEFCKSYSHDTSVCRSYANFVRAHPMASSRRTSPAQVNRQPEWIQPLVENNNAKNQNREQSQDREMGRRREISDIIRRHLEQVISTMIPSTTCNSIDPIESAPVNSMVTQPSDTEIEELEGKQTTVQKKNK